MSIVSHPKLFALVLIQAWLQGARVLDAQSHSDEVQIRQRLNLWVTQTRAGDRMAAAEIWAPDLIGWYPGQPDDTYAREMEQARRVRPPGAPRSLPDVTVEEVLVSGDLATVRDIWRITSIAGADTTYQIIKGIEIWRPQPDSVWRISRWVSAPEDPTKIRPWPEQ
jgi:ketosteroid isomerase-like protein